MHQFRQKGNLVGKPRLGLRLASIFLRCRFRLGKWRTYSPRLIWRRSYRLSQLDETARKVLAEGFLQPGQDGTEFQGMGQALQDFHMNEALDGYAKFLARSAWAANRSPGRIEKTVSRLTGASRSLPLG
jgi:hypothetical protein